MPATKNKNKGSAQAAWKSFHPGGDKKGLGCPGSIGDKTGSPSIVADSIYQLKLSNKLQFDVYSAQGTDRDYGVNYNDAYDDLYLAVTKAQKLLGLKGVTSMNPLKMGMSIGISLSIIIKRFKENIVPPGYQFAVHHSDFKKLYYFSIYKEVDFAWCWHTFEIKKPALYAKRKSKALHDLFIKTMTAFYHSTGITSWFNGGYGYADYIFEEPEDYVFNHFEEEDWEEEMAKITAAKEEYKNGDPAAYEKLLKSKKNVIPVKEILSRANRFDKKCPLVQFIKAVGEFLKLKGSLNDFIYPEMTSEWEGVQVDRQAMIIWQHDDAFYDMESQSMDNEASYMGVMPLYANIQISKTSTEIDFKKLDEMCGWPKKLSELHQVYVQKMKKIKA